ncbi:PD-(D/E)XK nuclease family protein [Flavobacterium sp. P21]|uniref:PDDEXK-like family protein n=1 Tax=Flavobacterium sp. P21 TaxID=3423948 RepID=UPI003D672618
MKTITTFYSIIKTKIELSKEFRKQYGKILSPDFNLFDFWYIDENKVSEVIAHFLNPKETHNQNDTFLKLFINHFDLDFKYTDTDNIEVECEHITHNKRRIDIVIRKNQWEQIIGIENKIYIWTADQINQIKDYIDYLEKVTKDNYCLLYLSPASKIISETSLSKVDFENYTNLNKLKTISYEDHIIELVHLFALHCESDRVRYFLLEFEKN